jgi:hypothetical protein
MREVTQTIFVGDPEGRLGNCLQACVASVLDLELEEVPHFVEFDDWWSIFWDFLHDQGCTVTRVSGLAEKGTGIGNGPSPRGLQYAHAVVVQDGKIVWDPHPSREGVPSFYDTWVIERVEP